MVRRICGTYNIPSDIEERHSRVLRGNGGGKAISLELEGCSEVEEHRPTDRVQYIGKYYDNALVEATKKGGKNYGAIAKRLRILLSSFPSFKYVF